MRLGRREVVAVVMISGSPLQTEPQLHDLLADLIGWGAAVRSEQLWLPMHLLFCLQFTLPVTHVITAGGSGEGQMPFSSVAGLFHFHSASLPGGWLADFWPVVHQT